MAGNLAGASRTTNSPVAAIHRALSLGVNWIDTAAVYGMGHSEEVVAFALQAPGRGPRPYVFTKCGLRWDEPGIRSPHFEAQTPFVASARTVCAGSRSM